MKIVDLSKIKRGDRILVTVKDEDNKEIYVKEGYFIKIDYPFGRDDPHILIQISNKRDFSTPLAWITKIEKLDN